MRNVHNWPADTDNQLRQAAGGERGRFRGDIGRSGRGKWLLGENEMNVRKEEKKQVGSGRPEMAVGKPKEKKSVGGVRRRKKMWHQQWLQLQGESHKGSWVSESKWAPEIITLWDIITSDSVIPAYWSVLTINWWHLNMSISWSRRKPEWFALVSAEASDPEATQDSYTSTLPLFLLPVF